MIEIMAAHGISYAATANIAYPEDLIRKFKKARDMKGGTRFIHVYATCTTGWGAPSEYAVKIARLATRCNMFPLYEVEEGITYTLNEKGDTPVDAYLNIQGRFKHLSEKDRKDIQAQVDKDFSLLKSKLPG